MNLYDFSETTNDEMGVLVQRDEDEAMYDQAVEEVALIQESSEEIKKPSSLAAMGKRFMGVVNDLADDAAGTPKKGFCIRCGQAIDFDTDTAIMSRMLRQLGSLQETNYPEKHCHRCGKSIKVSKREPLCPRGRRDMIESLPASCNGGRHAGTARKGTASDGSRMADLGGKRGYAAETNSSMALKYSAIPSISSVL